METCDVIFIMDRSGSMQTIRTDAIGGYNAMLEEQQALPGQCAWTLVTFDHHVTPEYTRAEIAHAPRLTETTYIPGGMTALYDAIGKTLTEAKNWQMPDNPDHKVIVAIMTDGHENSSKEYTVAQVRALTDELTAKGWVFQYMGANQDAFAVAQTMNMANQFTQTYDATSVGTRSAFGVAGQSMTVARGYSPGDQIVDPAADPKNGVKPWDSTDPSKRPDATA